MNTTLRPVIDTVLNLTTYVPSEQVNQAMGSLVETVIKTQGNEMNRLATSQQILAVRHISTEAESELEKFWARQIIASAAPLETLASFPYIENYTELTKREVALVQQSGLSLNSNHKALIVGSGPLPLSAYELHLQTGASVDHADSSHDAISLCEQLMTKLGITSRYYKALGQAVKLEDTYDLILIAALAGDTAADKQKIINTVLPHLRDGGRIIVRSAKGSRTLLYPGVKSDEIRNVKLLKEYHPTDYIINSVFVYGRYYETRLISY